MLPHGRQTPASEPGPTSTPSRGRNSLRPHLGLVSERIHHYRIGYNLHTQARRHTLAETVRMVNPKEFEPSHMASKRLLSGTRVAIHEDITCKLMG